MRKPHGYAQIVSPDAPLAEMDTAMCCHCQRIIFMHATPQLPNPDKGGFCIKCYSNVCGPCADQGVCTPFERELEKIEAKLCSF